MIFAHSAVSALNQLLANGAGDLSARATISVPSQALRMKTAAAPASRAVSSSPGRLRSVKRAPTVKTKGSPRARPASNSNAQLEPSIAQIFQASVVKQPCLSSSHSRLYTQAEQGLAAAPRRADDFPVRC